MFQPKDETNVRETRSARTNQVEVTNIRTVTGCKAFGFRGPNYWNKLEADTRIIPERKRSRTIYPDWYAGTSTILVNWRM